MRSKSTGRLVPKTCKSWLCPGCNVWLREGARKQIVIGAMTRPRGYDAALFTFTEPASASLDLPAFLSRHQRTVQALRYRGWLSSYCTAVEFQGRGALHPHIVARVPNALLPKLRPFREEKRNREQYAWWSNELRGLALDLGWGPVCDAVAAEGFNDLGYYAVKSLAAYTTKEAHKKFKAAGAKRVRPIRAARDWTPHLLRELQRGEKCDPGPWEDLTNVGLC